MEASSAVLQTFPATRTTNKSPKPLSKINSTGTLASAQLRTLAMGTWPFLAVRNLVTGSILGCLLTPSKYLRFPALSSFRAVSASGLFSFAWHEAASGPTSGIAKVIATGRVRNKNEFNDLLKNCFFTSCAHRFMESQYLLPCFREKKPT